jgi:hypothetical protein
MTRRWSRCRGYLVFRWAIRAALFWLMLLLPGSPAHHRNPPGTLERQAARLLLLLDCGG